VSGALPEQAYFLRAVASLDNARLARAANGLIGTRRTMER
jgi:hypothetical protein